MKIKFACMLVAASLVPALAQDLEDIRPASSSSEFESSSGKEVARLNALKFGDVLETRSLGSMPTSAIEKIQAQIRAAIQRSSDVSAGEPGALYDVIIQPGHFGRTKGRTGASGQLVTEQQLSAFIAFSVADALKARKLRVLVIPADGFVSSRTSVDPYKGLTAKAFLAIHADGAVKQCSTGPSMSYQAGSPMFGIHAVGYALATAMGYRYSDYRKDNFTANSAGYYAFNQLRAPRMKALLELGEITCPTSEKVLVQNASIVSANVAQALSFVVDNP